MQLIDDTVSYNDTNNNNDNNNTIIADTCNNNDIKEPTIAGFLAHKNIFITGGTGFLGTVLIESLLSSTPKIGTIYVLVRAKYGADANERIERMLSKQIFQNHSKEVLKKVVPIVGVMDAPNLGFDEQTLNDLCEKVNIIFHCAATIKFNSHLRIAIRTNLTGTLRTIEFAKKLKNLAAYIHLSTAFCNSNYRGLLSEKVYPPAQDPYEMLKLAENDEAWENCNTRADWAHIIKEHPNTYTFTKQLAENLVMKEMAGYPAGIVRPSVVYGTYEHPVQGWVGNANSGHLGFFAGYYKGLFRTIHGNPQSTIDVIPCDYVINSSLAIAWYVGTRKLEIPEVIHCTSGEQNPLSLQRFTDILNEKVSVNPSTKMVWIPNAKIRNGWRHTLFFYLFHILPTMIFYWPEKILHLGIRHHTSLEFMRIFHNGTKAFDFFLNKNFQYSTKNAMRIMSLLHPKDAKRYCFDANDCDWSVMLERCFLGCRRFFFKESFKTTRRHRIIYKCFEVLHVFGMALIFLLFFLTFLGLDYAFGLTSTSSLAFTLASLLWLFIAWL